MGTLTDEQLATAREVLEWLENYYRENEPYATNAISVLEAARMEIPDSTTELGD